MPNENLGQYDDLSECYHWLYSDHVLSGELALSVNADVLADAGPAARILDCSCGIGTLVVALGKRGLDVTGSDVSLGMIEQSTLASASAGLEIPLSCCSWENLPKQLIGSFDLVFCLGNSLGHSRDEEEMLRSLKGMRTVLRHGGKLVIQSCDWEHVWKEKDRFTVYQWRERAGTRCLPLYVWTFPERFEDALTIDVVLIFDSGGEASLRSYPIVYYPFHFAELEDRLRRAGFSQIDKLSESDAGYRVVAS